MHPLPVNYILSRACLNVQVPCKVTIANVILSMYGRQEGWSKLRFKYWGYNSAGRVSALQAESRGFKSL